MAQLTARRPENVEGDIFVDHTCIDCDTCRWMAPNVFGREGGMSAVHTQPATSEERIQALKALLSCPTASIGTVASPQDIKQAQAQLPEPVAENVYHCGYHSEKSYAATTYLIRRPEGNVLIDSPRFTPPLVKQLEAMGGVKYLYLTHRDDVADHAKFQEHFGCERILHADDITAETQSVEIQLQGQQPEQLAPDITIIPVPGHSKGHTVLLYQNQFLFTGDHLAWSVDLGHLYGFRRFCWYSWTEQIKSMKRLADYSFEWVLPGHGRRLHSTAMVQELQTCIAWMEQA
ncbi:MBL fold metallo-hydrolase [Leptothoe spongobia]|uniref:MBL fold metallo-hydrolase n=1 Tax=Leptothoe spongobia TAU-MAC 1115 TaxID=1967444 RepID=A0A947GKH0_9CYAN|nr:MBL fold metallo-hydrolase [Leptothoe spongobia]MBT9314111.1 MBL fold metallo-hydrolase [Leptothoe spongobia TAU-MAC 1115]